MAVESSVYLSGDSPEEICELLERGFLDDDVDFNKELDAVTSMEEIDDTKKKFLNVLCLGKSVFLLED